MFMLVKQFPQMKIQTKIEELSYNKIQVITHIVFIHLNYANLICNSKPQSKINCMIYQDLGISAKKVSTNVSILRNIWSKRRNICASD